MSSPTDASTDAAAEAQAPVVCGGTTCPAVAAAFAAAGVSNCCDSTGACGYETEWSGGKCLSLNSPGSLDPACPQFASSTGVTRPGCCQPNGQCGAMDSVLGLGCIPSADYGADAQACQYQAGPSCTNVVGVTCDGPEDCPGQVCCGFWNGMYTNFACMTSCSAPSDAGGEWFEMCHPGGQACQNSQYQCGSSSYLPSYLYRCYTTAAAASGPQGNADSVNCGSSACGAGQKCCVRPPETPYCANVGDTCACDGPDASTGDAAAADAATGDAGSTDAATGD